MEEVKEKEVEEEEKEADPEKEDEVEEEEEERWRKRRKMRRKRRKMRRKRRILANMVMHKPTYLNTTLSRENNPRLIKAYHISVPVLLLVTRQPIGNGQYTQLTTTNQHGDGGEGGGG